MPCYHPLSGWRARNSGPVLFVRPEATWCVAIQVPCGQCIGCRLERSRQWAVRLMHEASLHSENSFVTLTYSPENLPADMSLNKRHWQLFAKRLRKARGPFRFFHCGEYGEIGARPHYHAILFGMAFDDLVLLSGSGDRKLYSSKSLEGLWGLGMCSVGSVTFESAAYVARYALKKVTGDAAEAHYERVSDVTGEVFSVQPEYVTMSRRPGIARDWYLKYSNEVFPYDEVISRGFPSRPPRYYDNLLADAEPCVFDVIKRKRVARALKRSADSTPARLAVRERVTKAKLSLFKRRSL